MTVSVANQTILVTDVTKLVITEAVEDGEGGFVREIRIFGPNGDDGSPAVHVTRVQGATKEAIAITTPALDF